jgi:hypothetical protein
VCFSLLQQAAEVVTVFIASAVGVRLHGMYLPHELILHGGRDEYGPYNSFCFSAPKYETRPRKA